MAKLAQIGDAAPCRGHRMIHGPSGAGTRSKTTASSSPFQHIKNGPFRCRMRKLWPKQWRRGSWVGNELQLGEDHGVGVSSMAMFSSHHIPDIMRSGVNNKYSGVICKQAGKSACISERMRKAGWRGRVGCIRVIMAQVVACINILAND